MYKDIVEFIRSQFKTMEFIPLHAPVFNGNEKLYLEETIDSTFVSSVGKFVNKFEDIVKDYTGAKYAIPTVNGTAALHMSLILAGVKENDLVLTQSLSFIATCNAISYQKAEPVFIDVDKNTLGLSPDALKAFLLSECSQKGKQCFHKISGRRIAACIPMHTFGHPVQIDLIKSICDEYGIPLIEDAAESMGSFYKNVHTGNFGLLGAFSFNGNKTVTCGGGGVIITNDAKLAKLGTHLTTQAKIPHRWNFVHDHVGYNYRLPNLNAALACAQMEQLESFVVNKRQLAMNYKDFFSWSEITFIEEPVNTRSNYWLNTILVKDYKEREEILTFLNDAAIMARPCWTLMHKLPMFLNCYRDSQTNAQWLEDRLVNIPSSYRPNL